MLGEVDVAEAPSIHKEGWLVMGDGEVFPQGIGGARAGGRVEVERKPENTPAAAKGHCLAGWDPD